MTRIRIRLAIATLLLATAAIGATHAGAVEVSTDRTGVIVFDGGHEQNDVVASVTNRTATVTDRGSAVMTVSGNRCTLPTPQTARCTLPPVDGSPKSSRLGIHMYLGSGDDAASFGSVFPYSRDAFGDKGDDLIEVAQANQKERNPTLGRFEGGAGTDTLIGSDSPFAEYFDGGPGDDVIEGLGGAGGDLLVGEGGADQLLGGTGADVLKGGAGDDVEVGGPGADRVGNADDTGRDRMSIGDPPDSSQPDVINSRDGERDAPIDCSGQAHVKLRIDVGIDPAPRNCPQAN